MRESRTPLPLACSTHCATELGSKDPLNVSLQLNNQPSGRPVTSPDGLIKYPMNTEGPPTLRGTGVNQ